MVKPLVSFSSSGLSHVTNITCQSVNQPPTAIASLSKMNELNTISQQVEWKTNYLMKLKEKLESLPQFHQIEVLRILHSKSTSLNENKNGIFINITKLSDTTLTQLEEYINYVNTQEEHLNEFEEQKKLITREFFEQK
jgi:hypothetical protein